MQTWIEDRSILLDGNNNDGLLAELLEKRAIEKATETHKKLQRDKTLFYVSLIASIPVILKIAEHFHWF